MTSSRRVALLGSPPTCGAFATFNSTLLLLIYTCISGKKSDLGHGLFSHLLEQTI